MVAAAISNDLDPLYTVPLGEFTRYRNALAARLKAEGRRDAADAVRRMKRPSTPVWAVNALAREQADALRAFVDATDRLKRAQLTNPDAIGAASQAQRRALQALLRSSETILQRGRVRSTAQTIQRISGTLLGAVADSEARSDLLHGRLTEERQAPGFEALAGARPRPKTTRSDAMRELPRRASEDRRTAEQEARQAAPARAADLAANVRALEAEAAARERAAAEAARVVSELERQLRQAETRARALRREARAAATAAERARRRRHGRQRPSAALRTRNGRSTHR
jgi:hypothetical protein